MTLENFAENVGGKVWRKDGKVRIYFDTDKSANAYLDYDEDLGDEFEKGTEGAALKVFSNCEKQGVEWNKRLNDHHKFNIFVSLRLQRVECSGGCVSFLLCNPLGMNLTQGWRACRPCLVANL